MPRAELEVVGLRYCEEAVGRALADSGVPREELFVTTKQVCSLLHDRSRGEFAGGSSVSTSCLLPHHNLPKSALNSSHCSRGRVHLQPEEHRLSLNPHTPLTTVRACFSPWQHPRDHGYARTLEMLRGSLVNLQTDYVDLYLLHYPACWGTLCAGALVTGTWRDAWRALEQLHRDGKVRAIGVSNFSPQELEQLLQEAHIRPAVVQSHSDPLVANRPLQELCESRGIAFTAYSSLGTQHGFSQPNPVLTSPVIQEIASRLGRVPSQVRVNPPNPALGSTGRQP